VTHPLAEQTALERPAHDVGAPCNPELPHQPCTLGFRSPYRNVQLLCDVAIRVTVSKQESRCPLAIGEGIVDHAVTIRDTRANVIGIHTDARSYFLRRAGLYAAHNRESTNSAETWIDEVAV
jgi:hypothetical protein